MSQGKELVQLLNQELDLGMDGLAIDLMASRFDTAFFDEGEDVDVFGAQLYINSWDSAVTDDDIQGVKDNNEEYFEADLPDYTVSIDAPESVNENEEFDVTVTVDNTGETEVTQDIVLSINGYDDTEADFTVAAGESGSFTFDGITLENAGDLYISVNYGAVTESEALEVIEFIEGETFTLTEGIDTIEGTDGNDTFVGDHDTINLGDSIDGAAGHANKFEILLADDGDNTYFTGVDVVNVQQFWIRDLETDGTGAGNTTLNFDAVIGAEQIWADRSNSAGDTRVEDVQDQVTVGMFDTRDGTVFEVEYAGTIVADDEAPQAVVLDNIRGTTSTLEVSDGTNTLTAYEITSTGARDGANTLQELIDPNDIESITIDGGRDLEITNALGTSVVNVNAADLEAALDLTFGATDVDGADGFTFAGAQGENVIDFTSLANMDSADANVSITGGESDDEFSFANELSAIDTDAEVSIDGGEGTNTLVVTGDDAIDSNETDMEGVLSNFQIVENALGDEQDINITQVGGVELLVVEENSQNGTNSLTFNDGVEVQIADVSDYSYGVVLSVDNVDPAEDEIVSEQNVVYGSEDLDADKTFGDITLDNTASLSFTAQSDGDDRAITVGNIDAGGSGNNELNTISLNAESAALTMGTATTVNGAAEDTDVVTVNAQGDNDTTTGEITLGDNTNRVDYNVEGEGDHAIALADQSDLDAAADTDQAAGEGVVISGVGTGTATLAAGTSVLDGLTVNATGYAGTGAVEVNAGTDALDVRDFSSIDEYVLSFDINGGEFRGIEDGSTVIVETNQGNAPLDLRGREGGTLNIFLDGDSLGNGDGLDNGITVRNVNDLVITGEDYAATASVTVGGIVTADGIGDTDALESLTLNAATEGSDTNLNIDSAIEVGRSDAVSESNSFDLNLQGEGTILVDDLDLSSSAGDVSGDRTDITDLTVNTEVGDGDRVLTEVQMGEGAEVSLDLQGDGFVEIGTLTLEAATETLNINSVGANEEGEANEVGSDTALDMDYGDLEEIVFTGNQDLNVDVEIADSDFDTSAGVTLDASGFSGKLTLDIGQEATDTDNGNEHTVILGVGDADISLENRTDQTEDETDNDYYVFEFAGDDIGDVEVSDFVSYALTEASTTDDTDPANADVLDLSNFALGAFDETAFQAELDKIDGAGKTATYEGLNFEQDAGNLLITSDLFEGTIQLMGVKGEDLSAADNFVDWAI